MGKLYVLSQKKVSSSWKILASVFTPSPGPSEKKKNNKNENKTIKFKVTEYPM